MNFKDRRDRIEELRVELKQLQEDCNHPKSQITKLNCGSSGNWDPGDNKSWTEFRCLVCGHFWTKDHNET